MAKKSCYNQISNNTSYFISEIKDELLSKKERKKRNDRKTLKSVHEIVNELKSFYENIYDINLHIYRSRKCKTIIEVKYYSKLSLDSEFYDTIKDNEPMIHTKIGIPPYINRESRKFDINWELGGVKHQFYMFLYSLKSN